jgi:hypothetical protein
MDFIKINGTAVRLTSIHQRTIPRDDGLPLAETELVVILRGTMAHRAFLALLASPQLRLDIPEPDGDGWVTYDTEVFTAYSTSGDSGEVTVHRHDVVLRETPDSAARRAAEQTAHQPEPPPEPEPDTPPSPPAPEGDEDPDAPLDLSGVEVAAGNATVWATALRQMTSPQSSKPGVPPEPPLETPELAGAEAILVGLRLEALIEQLTAAGIVRRSSVDASFQRLVQQRFVAEATPVIGPKAAKRAADGAGSR